MIEGEETMADIDIEFLDKVLAQVTAVAKEPYFDHERGSWMCWEQGDWQTVGIYSPDLQRVLEADPIALRRSEWGEGKQGGKSQRVEEEQCGTAFCLAGWAVELDPDVTWYPASAPPPPGWSGNVANNSYVVVDGAPEPVHVETWAKDRLGLTVRQADLLFDGANTLEDLEDYATRIKDGDSLEVDYADRLEGCCCGRIIDTTDIVDSVPSVVVTEYFREWAQGRSAE